VQLLRALERKGFASGSLERSIVETLAAAKKEKFPRNGGKMRSKLRRVDRKNIFY